jgi:xylobiose transport system substrate-binding protein
MTMNDPSPTRRGFLGLMTAAGVSAPLAGLAAGCGTAGPGSSSGGSKTDQVWTLTDAVMNPIQNKAIGAFNKTSKTQLNLVTTPNASYTQKLRVAMGSPNAPSLLFNWGLASIQPYVQAGQLVDLTPKLDADPAWKNMFLANVLADGQIGGKYYGIPLRGMQPVVLFYNKTMFAQYGAQPPKTFNDLLSLVDLFKGKGITPIVLGGADQFPELMYLELLTDRIAGPGPYQGLLQDPAGGWSNPAFQQALSMCQELVARGAFGPNYNSTSWNNGTATTIFTTGKAAMELMGSWEYAKAFGQAPDWTKKSLGFTPFPVVEGGKGNPDALAGNPTNYFSVYAKSPDVDAAINFLKQQMASPSFVGNLITAGDVPAVTGIESKLSSMGPAPEFALWVYHSVQNAPSFALSWDQALPASVKTPMLDNLQKVFLRQMTPAQFTSSLQKAQ